MKILLLGSNGNISFNVFEELHKNGLQVTAVNRGSSDLYKRYLSNSTNKNLFFDVNLESEYPNIDNYYDYVIDFLCFNENNAKLRVKNLINRVGKYILISTTAGYIGQKNSPPYTEKSAFNNINWSYVNNKKKAEDFLLKAKKNYNFPLLICRLGHTCDTKFPVQIGPDNWTTPSRILNNLPIYLLGNGQSIWSVTHSNDVAKIICKIINRKKIDIDILNIVNNRFHSWTDIYDIYNKLFDKVINIKYISIDDIAFLPEKYLNQIKYHKQFDDFYSNELLNETLDEEYIFSSLEDILSAAMNFHIKNKLFNVDVGFNEDLKKYLE